MHFNQIITYLFRARTKIITFLYLPDYFAQLLIDSRIFIQETVV